jgi:hypothetical protein
MPDALNTTITVSRGALSRLAWLCDARVHFLRKCLKENEENFGNDLGEDDISDAEMDIAYFEGLASQLRSWRDA